MRGVTFGHPFFFETAIGRVEPDAELYFALLLQAAAADPEVGVGRDELASMLWTESAIEAARHNLRQAMYRLRQLGFPIHLNAAHVTLADMDTEIDLRDLLRGGLSGADLLSVCTQPFLRGYFPRISSEYSMWLDELRQRVDRVRRSALVEAVRTARSSARYREVDKLSRALLKLDPLNETATLALAEAMVMDGSKVEALRMLEEYEAEVGRVSEALRIPARTLRRRVSESLEASLMPRQFEIPFVGRDAEFRVMREGFLRVREGKSQAFVITGAGGIGKTRLAHEVMRLAVLDGARVIQYFCTSGDGITPLSSLLTITQALLDAPGALGCGMEHLQYLRQIVTPDSEAIGAGVTADVAHAHLVHSLSELIAAVTDESDLILFVDDAHRLHQSTWRILFDLVDRLASRKLLVLLTARQLPEWYASLGYDRSRERSAVLSLGALSEDVSRNFVASWLEKNAIDATPEAQARVLGVSSGNPFYLEEFLAQLGRGEATAETPETIRALVQRQFAALSKAAQRCLVAVALLQNHATLRRVRAVLQQTPLDFTTLLEELELAGLVHTMGSRVSLRHDVVAEATLAVAPTAVTQYLRERTAVRLEAEGRRKHSPSLLNDAVAHWQKALQPRRATRVTLRLGDALMARGLHADAIAVYTRVSADAKEPRTAQLASLGCQRAMARANDWTGLLATPSVLTRLSTSADSLSRNADLQLDRVEAQIMTAAPSIALDDLTAILHNRSVPVQQRARALLLTYMCADNGFIDKGSVLARCSDYDEVLTSAGIAQEGALLTRIIHALLDDDLDEARSLLPGFVTQAFRQPLVRRPRSIRHAAHAALRCGEYALALTLAKESIRLAESLQLPHHIAPAYELFSRCNVHLGLWDQAYAAARHAYDLHARHSPALTASTMRTQYAFMIAIMEDATQASQLLTSAHSDGASCTSLRRADRVALSRFAPHLLDDETVTWCQSEGLLDFGRGPFDASVTVAASAILRHCGIDDARAFIERYLREYRPPVRSNRKTWDLLAEPLRDFALETIALLGIQYD